MANPKVQVNARIDPELYAELVRKAEKQGESLSAVIEVALRRELHMFEDAAA